MNTWDGGDWSTHGMVPFIVRVCLLTFIHQSGNRLNTCPEVGVLSDGGARQVDGQHYQRSRPL